MLERKMRLPQKQMRPKMWQPNFLHRAYVGFHQSTWLDNGPPEDLLGNVRWRVLTKELNIWSFSVIRRVRTTEVLQYERRDPCVAASINSIR